MARYRKNRRKYLRGGNKRINKTFEHNEPPTATEAVRQQQAGAVNDAEIQMAMNQSGGSQDGGELHVPQSGAASPEGNDAMAQSAGMLMQSRQNAPKKRDSPDIKTGGRRKKTRRKRKRKTKSTKKKRKRKTKKKYKFARKYHQRGCSRRKCKRR